MIYPQHILVVLISLFHSAPSLTERVGLFLMIMMMMMMMMMMVKVVKVVEVMLLLLRLLPVLKSWVCGG